jgi:hypothetical protein
MMRTSLPIAALLAFASASAPAQSHRYDPKALARYDVSYVKCEASFPDMKGHRDEAYLALWHAQLSPRSISRLEEVRKSGAYKAEQQRAARQAKQPAEAEAAKKLERQCRGLWGEYVKMPKAPAS